jgi:transcriptional regulator with XRE-family HTH domain
VSRPAPNLRVLGSVLRAFRNGKGYTQERLSFKSGLTTALISDAENGKRNLSFTSIERWLVALDVSWETFGAEVNGAARMRRSVARSSART